MRAPPYTPKMLLCLTRDGKEKPPIKLPPLIGSALYKVEILIMGFWRWHEFRGSFGLGCATGHGVPWHFVLAVARNLAQEKSNEQKLRS